jgi:poly-beta-1,6-N-acetyl-D-glucosamine synthase
VTLFWACCTLLLWTYAGYPGLMVVRAAVSRRVRARAAGLAEAAGVAAAPEEGAALPGVTVILAVRNAEAELWGRVTNLLEQRYPAERLDVIIACNGCTDATETIAAELASADERIRFVRSAAEAGKAGSLNAAAALSAADVLVFADVRQRFEANAVRELVRTLSDTSVGAVTGRLVIGAGNDSTVDGVGRYWQMETQLRLAESETGSLVSATGAIYAIRRALFRPLPPAVILDDMYVPLSVVRQGYRVAMAPLAVAHDRASNDGAAEYRRRVRTLVGNYELLRLMPWLVSPVGNPVFIRYVSHKLLRLATPLLCIGMVISGLLQPGLVYRGAASALLMAYLLGALGLVVPLKALALPSAFLLLHRAGIAALLRPARRASDVWVP